MALDYDQDRAKDVSIFAIIVLYKMRPEDSCALRTLQETRASISGTSIRLKILLFDNTPPGGAPAHLPPDVMYKASETNLGLASAYNEALNMAETSGFEWLLTLDQDTAVPPNFMEEVSNVALRLAGDPSVAAIVPQIIGEGRMLSPSYLLAGAIPRFYARGYTGIPSRATYAFNSGSLLRVSALKEVGGYSPLFWLDYCDAYIYHQLNKCGKRVYVAGNVQVEHEFAMFDMNNRVSLDRYRNSLEAASAFLDREMGTLAGLYHTASLIYRMYKHWKRKNDAAFRRETVALLWRRIFQSRSSRLREWEALMAARTAEHGSGIRRRGSNV